MIDSLRKVRAMWFWGCEIAAAWWFGFELASFLSTPAFTPVTRLAIGFPLGQTIFAWVTFLLSSRGSFSPHHGLFSSLFLGILSYFLNHHNCQHAKPHRQPFNLVAIVTFFMFGALLTWTFYYAMLYDSASTVGAGYADLPFHLSLITSFTLGCNNHRRHVFDLVSPFYAGEPLAYSFMPDFYTAALLLSGSAPLRQALFLPSLLYGFSLIYAVYTVAVSLTGNPYVGLLANFLFFNLGGLGFTRWSDPSRDWRGDSVFGWGRSEHAYWFHPIMQVLIPQRGALFALPLCYWALLALIQGVHDDDERLMALAGVLTALTPQVMVHGYVALAQWALAFCMVRFPWRHRSKWLPYVRLWLWFGAIAVCLGVPQFYPFLARLANPASGRFVTLVPTFEVFRSNIQNAPPGWLALPVLWWRALGLFAGIALGAGFLVLDRRQLMTYYPSLLVFAVTNFVLYQPWECDNLKIYYAVWIPIALPVVGLYIYQLIRRKTTAAIGVVLLAACAMSAAWQTGAQMKRMWTIAPPEGVRAGLWVAENVPRSAVFLNTPWHASPVTEIGGRQTFLASYGWATGHGLEKAARGRALRAMQAAVDDIPLFERNNVTYVYSWGEDDAAAFNRLGNHSDWIKVWEMRSQRIWRRL